MNGSSDPFNDFRKKHAFKVVLLGEGAVGKSSLLLRYVQNKFLHEHLSTLQVIFLNLQFIFNNFLRLLLLQKN